MSAEKTFFRVLFQALSSTRPDGSKAIGVLQRMLEKIAQDNGYRTWTDTAGNLWCDRPGRTVFTAHLDTVCGKEEKPIKLLWNGMTARTDGKTTLGADDGAGIAMLAGLMAAQIGGTFIFTQGEEIGGYGAKTAAKYIQAGEFDRAIAFDRKGTTDICGSQCVGTLASRDFVSALAAQLGMGHSWASGLYTDNAEFQGLIPEIVNIACGYEANHSMKETLDVQYLRDLFRAALTVDWENLPVVGPQEEAAVVQSWDKDLIDWEFEQLLEEAADDLDIDYHSYKFGLLRTALLDAMDLGMDREANYHRELRLVKE